VIAKLGLLIVIAAGAFFVALGATAIVAPARARTFLLAFAQSPKAHYAELAIRMLAGAAFVMVAPRSLAPELFRLFGWVLLLTSAGLALLPWRWHRRFAKYGVPKALRFLPLLAIVSSALGGLVLWAVLAL
jgi:hypothetical protein